MRRICGPDDVAEFIALARRGLRAGSLNLDLGETQGIFPNGAVPLAVAMQYFKAEGLRLQFSSISEDVQRTHLLEPVNASVTNLGRFPLKNVVWRYHDETEANALSNAFVTALEEAVECEQGVIESLNWCLYEVMDNVFQHSHAESGYAMMQLHRKSKWCAVAVSDDGIGIYRSFRDNQVYSAKDEYESIMLAVQEKVTSKPKNMGNGLYGLMRVVGLNAGELEIRSGRGWLAYREGRVTGGSSLSRPVLDAEDHRGTTVDWQLDVSRPVSLVEALGMKQTNMRLESLEDDQGEHRVLVAEFEEGLGTRRSAEQVRTRLLNLLNEGVSKLVLDFTNVTVVSSSFADEVLGKLALQMGLLQFFNRFRMDNMTDTVRALVERAIQQRVAEGDVGYPGADRGTN